MAVSKNSNTGKKVKSTTKMVISSDCEDCTSKCNRGIQYLEVFKLKKDGKGVPCNKV